MGLFAHLKEKFSKKKDEPVSRKYDKGLRKSREAFGSRLDALSKRYKEVNAEYFEELEQILIESDVGVSLTLKIIEQLLDKSKKDNIKDPAKINEELIDMMFVGYLDKGASIVNEIAFHEGTTVLMVEGVNGVGKTTTIAKLAHRYKDQGKSVLLVAGDTFRAGAVEQLQVWANRLEIPIVTGPVGSDPASVCFDGATYAVKNNIDLMIVDTAGRLQNKSNLMAELGKMKRVIAKVIPNAPDEVFLIIDATTGQNGVSQAAAFREVNDLTGIVITKMDGTSKGGIILSIREEVGVPVRFVGLGENMEDLEEFDLDDYLHGLLVGEDDGTY